MNSAHLTTACLAVAALVSCIGGGKQPGGNGAQDDAGAVFDALPEASVEGASDASATSEAGVPQGDGGEFASPTVIATGQAPGFVALDSTHVYWSNNQPPPAGASGQGQIMECGLGGCAGPPLSLWSGLYGVNGLGVAGLDVYWPTGAGTGVSSSPLIMMCASAGCGGAPSTVAEVADNVRGFVTDATNAYWTTGAGLVRSCALSGCAGGPTTIASQQNGPQAIAVNGTDVYWVNLDDGTVVTCPISGCANGPSILASGRRRPAAITADASRLYWIELGTMVGGGNAPDPGIHGGPSSGLFARRLRRVTDRDRFVCLMARRRGHRFRRGAHVYWSAEDTGGTSGEIVTCSVDGCNAAPTPIAKTLQTSQTPRQGLRAEQSSRLLDGHGRRRGSEPSEVSSGCPAGDYCFGWRQLRRGHSPCGQGLLDCR